MARRKKVKTGLNALGDLEVDVMGIVWNLEGATVKDVFKIMYERRRLAYTTIMTVMNRLAAKGMLAQDRTSIPYNYTPAIKRVDVVAEILDDVVERLLAGNLGGLPHGFVTAIKRYKP